MDKIIFPLRSQMKGFGITNLHKTLGALGLDVAEKEQVDKRFGASTRRAVLDLQTKHGLDPSGVVDEKTAALITELVSRLHPVLFGQVTLADGSPLEEGMVRAFSKDLRSERFLGEAPTDKAGRYEIRISHDQWLSGEDKDANLVVKVFAPDDSLLTISSVSYNALPSASMDLAIPAEARQPLTLFERINSTIKPLLGSVKIEELEENQEHQDITFLSGKTGFEKHMIARFVLAHRLVHLGINKEFWFALLGGSFFKYAENESLKQNQAVVSNALPSLDTRAVHKILAGSLNRREIPADLRKQVDTWIEAFLEVVGHLVLGDAKSPTFARMALGHAGIDSADKRAKFARLFHQYRALTPELLGVLEKDRTFKETEIADLHTLYRLAELTRGDFSVAKMLKEEFDIRQPEQIRTLARQSERQWIELIERKHKAGEIIVPLSLGELAGTVSLPETETYAKSLQRQFREAFPTVAFAGGLERALSSNSVHGVRYAESLLQIIDYHPEFNLLRTSVDEFLTKGIGSEFRSLAKDEPFRLEFKAVQRVFKLTLTFEGTDALLADGLHSAQMIYRLGESEFVRRYGTRSGFSVDSARRAWNRAADTHAAVLTVIGDLKALDPGTLPLVLNSDTEAPKRFPNWENLFVEGDICHCEQCHSMLSPAAYFTDLLMFLKDRNSKKSKSNGEKYSVKDILFNRRPDLGYIELNCENALTKLPYVDIVCEVLEHVVADPRNDVRLVGFSAMPAGSDDARAAVTAALSANGISVGSTYTLSQVDPADRGRWVVHGDDATYLLRKKKRKPYFFAEILPNTKASSEELRAYPAYVNPEAYKIIKSAEYPLAVPLDLFDEGDPRRVEQRARAFSLPFDLFAEEVRAAFQKSNLQRWDLMRAFRGKVEPNNPTDGEIAAEYFGISCNATAVIDEMRLILQERETDEEQRAVWGEADNPGWVNTLSNVEAFLSKTGLEYEELEALLDLPIINPVRDIFIPCDNACCDLDEREIKALDGPTLDRIHRFLRLWRKLGSWKLWELDLAIRCPGIGSGTLDEQFLVNLYYFERLRTRLGVKTTVEQLCGLFDDVNIETHFTKLHEKRADGLYQSLFLNKLLVQPLDPGFEIDPAKNNIKPACDPNTSQPILDPNTGLQVPSKISNHHAVFIAALSIKEPDLLLLKTMTKADGTPCINDDLTLANLSFIWRHVWLGKLLKFKADEWKTVLKLFQQDAPIPGFADPKKALEFVENIDHLRDTGFSPDELNWLLANDRSAKAAIKETDAARFLTALRKDLQKIQAEYDPAQYIFLSPPRDVESPTVLVNSLLRTLDRDEIEASAFLKTLRGPVILEADVRGLGVGFTFPARIVGAPNYIPISCESVLRFSGLMSASQYTILLNDPSLATVTGNPSYRPAIQDLFELTGQATATGLPAGFAFPAAITGGSNNIPIRCETVLRFNGVMTDAQRTILLEDVSLGVTKDNVEYRNAIGDLYRQSAAASENFAFAQVGDVLTDVALPADRPSIPIRYNSKTRKLSFVGVMTDTERLALAAVGNPTDAIEELFRIPRLAIKFFEPVFTAHLDTLPHAIDFKSQLSADLAAKISYDTERKLLCFAGIMSNTEKTELDNLAAETAYRDAVYQLAAQPQTMALPNDRIWLIYDDLDPSQRDFNTLAKRLAIAAKKGLDYLKNTLSANSVVQQSSAQLGLTEALTRHLLTHYALSPESLLSHLTGAFAAAPGVVDYANGTYKPTFDGWYWANRSAMLLKKWKLTFTELERVIDAAGAQLLGFLVLYTQPVAPMDCFLRFSRLIHFKESLPETNITLLEVLKKLNGGEYATVADFADDIQRLNDAWGDSDVETLIGSLDLIYPKDYLLAENLERLRQVFCFAANLNACVETVKTFAAAAMTDTHAKTLKELLRSKFGTETWLALSAEIQDALRERKRDALVAYLLTHPKLDDAPPTGKWENPNDLYAYYLLDVEMNACQLTSRLIQASGSVQLFVQRCFMGLEPDIRAQADGDDGDSAWRWWNWMHRYRVWEANRKIFLWPENWIEPELRKDSSSFFKDLQNELIQNDINQYTVQTAFANYLEKLSGVAELEIAGFYQEDDGDNTILHVFGRTKGGEPHLYYYRRYDYRQWSPWEKVELDIQGDYLMPAVANKRLFLLWPVFTEVPDETANKTAKVPEAGDTTIEPEQTRKRLKLQMAASEYRQGKWTPKRISQSYVQSTQYDTAITKEYYRFLPIDMGELSKDFLISYLGFSHWKGIIKVARFRGAFVMYGAKDMLEKMVCASDECSPRLDLEPWLKFPLEGTPVIQPEEESTGKQPINLKWVERDLTSSDGDPEDDFTLDNLLMDQSSNRYTQVLGMTPGHFTETPPWFLSYFDRLWLAYQLGIPRQAQEVVGFQGGQAIIEVSPIRKTLQGIWSPFFYNDEKRTFFVLPTLQDANSDPMVPMLDTTRRNYYPDIKRAFMQSEVDIEAEIQAFIDGTEFADLLVSLTQEQRQQLAKSLQSTLYEEVSPTCTDEQFKPLIVKALMRCGARPYLGATAYRFFQSKRFHFKNFYAPFVSDFVTLVNNPLKGIASLMSRETQMTNSGFSFSTTYKPTENVVEEPTDSNEIDAYPKEVVDFSPDGAYSLYSMELFFHAPLFIANQLSKNQRFEEARDWYHFIFNPIGVESPMPGGSLMSKYWITKPFFETTDPQYIQQRIDNILHMLAGDTNVSEYSEQLRKDLEGQVLDWRTNPFEPHRIATYRRIAYQKTVVMKYLDNLIAWGDYLFRQESMESINEAIQLYILAAEILGPCPKKIPSQVKPSTESFNELENHLDCFSNALVQIENHVSVMSGDGQNSSGTVPLPMLYFCIPQNDKMLEYWPIVADRLYKIRHCMNIEGVVRQLDLTEPPIEPGALVKAVAAGMDISTALADLNAPLPLYRFTMLLQKANEVCNDVKALGSVLLAALEKKDAETLALLRQSQEITVQEAVRIVREKQGAEAKENVEGLKKTKITIEARRNYYRDIDKIIPGEQLNLDKQQAAFSHQNQAQEYNIFASILGYYPNITIGTAGYGGSPTVNAQWGTGNIISALQAIAGSENNLSSAAGFEANRASILAGYDRRFDDWKLQEKIADKELEQIDKQIAAAELRVAIAEKELENHNLQIENAKVMDAFMRSKYTNEELYQWQVGQISGVYFKSYKLAYDLAKRAERCFRFELGLQDSSYINFGHWDSLRKGLLSGEKLQYDLRKLETAYLEQNRREFELTKHISLARLDPLALVKLRETGRCFFRLPEELFDIDYPGHYFRRVKSVSLTLPCVAGPYATIACTLRLLKNSIRVTTTNGDNGYSRNTDDAGLPADDPRFVESNIPVKSIATSGGQNDSGMFELSFRDERYLPFEGAGAISEWSLDLFNDIPANNPDPASPDFGRPLRQFDYSSITDIVLHVKYTAREDAGVFKNGAITHLRNYLREDEKTSSLLALDLRRDFGTQWSRFLNPENPAKGNAFELEMSPVLFPMRDAGKTLKINTIYLVARCTNAGNYETTLTPPLPEPSPEQLAEQPPKVTNIIALAKSNTYGGLHFGQKDVTAASVKIVPDVSPVTWRITITNPDGKNLIKDPVKKIMEVEDVIMVLGYQWE